MNQQLLMSIIIPCYNGERYINETIDSVVNQSYFNFELIIVNDGSTDSSLKIIEGFEDKRIQVINKVNSGVSDTRNVGLKLSKGSFILFLDADDIIEPEFIETAIIFLNKNPDYGFITTNISNIDKEGKLINSNIKTRGTYSQIQKEIGSFSICVSTCPSAYIYRKALLEKQSVIFNTNLQSAADRYFLLQIGRYAKGKLLEKNYLRYRIHDQSMSQTKNKGLIYEQEKYYNSVLKNKVMKDPKDLIIFKKKMHYQLLIDFIKLKDFKRIFKYGLKYASTLLKESK